MRLKEKDFLYEAIIALEKNSDLRINFESSHDIFAKNDGNIIFENSVHLPVEIKKGVRKHHIKQLQEKYRENSHWILISDYLSKPLQEYLKENKIFYLDAVGNTYIRLPSLLLHIKGEPRKETPKSTSKLTQAEVRALFFLISNPDLLTYSYRKLEPILGVGVATLSKLFSFLKVKGFINPDVRPFSFENLEELKDFWIASYGETLKPRLLRGRFRFSKNGGSRSWETWELGKEVLWSGEAALARISDYYLPGEWEIYTSLPTIELIKRYRIIPDSEGAIGVYQKFWNEAANLSLNIPSLAPDLLIEADIKLGGKARASQIFRDRYAQHA